jgi:plasmid stability protein
MHPFLRTKRTSVGPTMERATITLPGSLARRLRIEAQVTGRSLSAVARDALEAYLGSDESPPLPSFAAAGASGRHDVSERAEELIAAAQKRKRTS